MSGWYLPGGGTGVGGHILVTEFRGMALNGLFCADVLRPLDLVLLTDFTYKYHPVYALTSVFLPGASTPYKRWSKCTMKKVGEAFLQKLRGEVHFLLMHFPLSFCKNAMINFSAN